MLFCSVDKVVSLDEPSVIDVVGLVIHFFFVHIVVGYPYSVIIKFAKDVVFVCFWLFSNIFCLVIYKLNNIINLFFSLKRQTVIVFS